MMVRIKICGITNLADALKSQELGAHALGFNFYPKSPRYITKEKAKKIIKMLPPFIVTVGVFVNEDIDEINNIIEYTGIEVVQLHGYETQDYCSKFSLPVVKTLRINDKNDLKYINSYKVSAFLLDSYSKGYGGSGKSFDWEIAIGAKRYGNIILAGGLNEKNILEAIKRVKPYGVDVCSGVEKAPGKKDHDKLERFINIVKGL